VPSCRAHNNDNSRDVEYVRDIIAAAAVGDCVDDVWQKGVLKAASHGRGTFLKLQRKSDEYSHDGREIQAIDLETARFRSVFCAIGDALRFHLYKEPRQHNWHVYSPLLFSHIAAEPLKAMIDGVAAAAHWDIQESKKPCCFQWATYMHGEQLWIRLIFYKVLDFYLIERLTR
jgi:hypothetical protein